MCCELTLVEGSDMSKRLDWIQEEINLLKESGLYNRIRTISSAQGPWLIVDGRRVLNFCSNDYLGLANHPEMVQRAKLYLDQYGVGPAAVRSIAGTLDLHLELEKRVAAFKGVEAAITFQSGYCANLATIPALVGKEDVIFSDELNHASIIDGSRLSGAAIVRFAHADALDLARVIGRINPNIGACCALPMAFSVWMATWRRWIKSMRLPAPMRSC